MHGKFELGTKAIGPRQMHLLPKLRNKAQNKMVSHPMTEPAKPVDQQPAGPLKRYGPLAALAAGFIAIYATGAHEYLSLNAIAENRDALMAFVENNLVLSIGIYAVAYIITVAFSLPGAALLTILGGFFFGPVAGTLVTVIAATIGATAVFLIARSAIGDALVRKAGAKIRQLADGFKSDAFSYLLFLRLVPLFPFFVVNIAPALFNVGLGTYVVATLIGIIPGTMAFSFVGSGLDSIIMAQKQANLECIAEKGAENCPFKLDAGSLITTEIFVAFVLLGIVSLIPVVLKKFKARKSPAN
jgi:uncharacterized membrane protein YdjX (TVP38/TMEM64 family)